MNLALLGCDVQVIARKTLFCSALHAAFDPLENCSGQSTLTCRPPVSLEICTIS